MFDVSWGDPARETVGQRKNRKEQQSSTAHSGSASLRSSKSSSKSNDSARQTGTRVSLLTLFGGGNRKEKEKQKSNLNSNREQNTLSSKSAKPRPLKQESDPSRRYSSYTERTGSVHDEPITPRAIDDFFFMTPPEIVSQQSRRTDTSIFSSRTGHSYATNTSWGSLLNSSRKPSLVQPWSPKSLVTHSSEVAVSSRAESINSAEQVATQIHIVSNGTLPVEVKSVSLDSSTLIPPLNSKIAHESSFETLATTHEEELLEPAKWPNWQLPETWKSSPDDLGSPISTPLPSSPPPPQSPLPTLPKHSLSTSTKRSRRKFKRDPIPTELSHMQKNIRMKEAATPKIMLERLKEEWHVNVDASVYRELEFEKQLWMLTALKAQNKDDEPEKRPLSGISSKTSSTTTVTRPTKLLSLYENQASASFLSALNPTSEVHHLSTAPLSPMSYPNVYPLLTQLPTNQLPYADNQFNAVYSFSLSGGVLPSSSIPPMLKEIHRTLTSTGGRLLLTIIDPSPSPATTGPRLRSWLESHLVTNLERQFRCLSPSKLFPLWLADAGLRAEGSTIRSLKFKAVMPESLDNWGFDMPGSVGVENFSLKSENLANYRIGEELGSIVGRMLWKEMWGPWVEGLEWWWEDAEILEECARMGTLWEYSVIEGVRDN